MVLTMRIMELVDGATCGTCGQQFERHDHTGKPARESGDCPTCLDAFQGEAFLPDHAGLKIQAAADVTVEYGVRGGTARIVVREENQERTFELVGKRREVEKLVARIQRKVFG